MLAGSGRIFRFVLSGELRQLVFRYGFFKVHKFYLFVFERAISS
jgi:hypothetical protein